MNRTRLLILLALLLIAVGAIGILLIYNYYDRPAPLPPSHPNSEEFGDLVAAPRLAHEGIEIIGVLFGSVLACLVMLAGATALIMGLVRLRRPPT